MTALGKTSPAEARSAKTKTLRDIATGEVISKGYDLLATLNTKWNWISRAVARHFECDESDVHCLETDNGDVITIGDRPVAYIEGEYEPLFELLQAAE